MYARFKRGSKKDYTKELEELKGVLETGCKEYYKKPKKRDLITPTKRLNSTKASWNLVEFINLSLKRILYRLVRFIKC